MPLKSPQPYPVHNAGTGSPHFVTDADVTYFCIFQDITNLSPIFYSYDIHIYEFAFFGNTTHLDDHPLPVDFRIMETVTEIIRSFLDVPDRIVAYRCDYSDGQQGKRRARFDRAFNRNPGNVVKETTELVKVMNGKEHSTFAAILYRNDFAEKKLLKDYFTDVIYQIFDEKYQGGFFFMFA